MLSVLIVEGDAAVRARMEGVASRQASVRVEATSSANAALAALSCGKFDLALVDIPPVGGPACEASDDETMSLLITLGHVGTSVIITSASHKVDLSDGALEALQAFDILTKPYGYDQLESKVTQVLSLRLASRTEALRLRPGAASPRHVDDDPSHFPGLQWKNQAVRLTVEEYLLVHALLLADGKPVSHATLAAEAGMGNSTADLATLICGVRKKFKANDGHFNAVRVEPGFGYVWTNEN